MKILIPIDDDKNICSLEKNSSWALATLDEGEIKNISFFNSKDEIEGFIDYVVVISKEEFISDFFLEGIAILLAATQKSIEDILEAFVFRELHEVLS